jgi:hypothetical protein
VVALVLAGIAFLLLRAWQRRRRAGAAFRAGDA